MITPLCDIYFSAHKKACLIRNDLKILRQGILISHHAIITDVTVTAGTATDERSMYLLDPKEV